MGRELARTATNSGADVVPICLSETQFETFQEIRDFDFSLGSGGSQPKWGFCRRRTNVQQLTCKIDLSKSFYYLFFSFVLIELKPFVLKGKSWGKILKECEKVLKSVKNYETILPFSCCPLVFLWFGVGAKKFMLKKFMCFYCPFFLPEIPACPWMPRQTPFFTLAHRENTRMLRLICQQLLIWCGIRWFFEFWLCMWLGHPRSSAIVTDIITKLILPEYSPVANRSKITKINNSRISAQ